MVSLQAYHSDMVDSTHIGLLSLPLATSQTDWRVGWFYCCLKACNLSLDVGFSFCYCWNKTATLSLQLPDGRGRLLFIHTSCSSRERPYAEDITVAGSLVIVAFTSVVLYSSCTFTSYPFHKPAVTPSIVIVYAATACFLTSQGMR